jgi:hypothetical protein
LLLANYDLQTIQRLLGQSDVKTTVIYLQTVPTVTLKEAKSPFDLDPAPGRACRDGRGLPALSRRAAGGIWLSD